MVSKGAPLVLHSELVLLSLMLAPLSTLSSWHQCPRCSAGLMLRTGHSCSVEHNWNTTSLVSFSPFSHISGIRASVVLEKVLLHTVLSQAVESTH